MLLVAGFTAAVAPVRSRARLCRNFGGQNGGFSTRTSVSLDSHSTDCCTFILGWYNRPNSGRVPSGAKQQRYLSLPVRELARSAYPIPLAHFTWSMKVTPLTQ